MEGEGPVDFIEVGSKLQACPFSSVTAGNMRSKLANITCPKKISDTDCFYY